MIDTANSLQRSGLKDEKVIFDLTLSQYPEPVEGFREYEKKLEIKRRSKRRHYINSVLSLAYVLLSATSLNGELTLSMCVRGNEKDKTVVEKFFDLMEKNIKVIAEEKI